jgi:uncharacterized protein (UPF0335 family)
MARKKNGESESPRPASNGYDPDEVKSFVSRVENLYGDLDKEKSAYMLDCKQIRGAMKEVYDEAKEAGIPKKELKAVIKARALERKAEAARDDLEAESQDTFDMIRHALGDLADLPLGQAALGTEEQAAAGVAG